jgi:hypothetical protein
MWQNPWIKGITCGIKKETDPYLIKGGARFQSEKPNTYS